MFYKGDYVTAAFTRNAWELPKIGRVIAVNGNTVTVQYDGEIISTVKTQRATSLTLAYA